MMNKDDIHVIPEPFRPLVASMSNRIVYLTEENNRLRREIYGSKGEKHVVGEIIHPKGCLFNEPEAIVEKEPEEIKPDPVPPKPTTKRSPASGGRKPFPEHLPRQRKVYDLPESEKICPFDGTPLVQVGERVVETLHVEPIKASVTQNVYPKYACPCCKSHMAEAPAEPVALPQASCDASTVALILCQKFALGLPLYRLEQMFMQLDLEVSRTSMARWVIAAADVIADLAFEIRKYIFDQPAAHADETTVQVLKETGKTAQSNSYMWVACSSKNAFPAVWFEYSPDRTKDSAKHLIGKYSGILHVDGFPGYNSAIQNNGITRVGCWAHVRRKFDVAKKDGATSGKTLAAEFLDDIQALFMHEREFEKLLPIEKVTLRKEVSGPVIQSIEKRLHNFRHQVPPKSKLGEALTYLANQWDSLIVFLEHGEAELSNNRIENHIRPFAIGRKNWLFSDTVKGADASAIVYSVVCSAKANGLNIHQYLTFLLTELPRVYSKNLNPDLTEFLPWNFKL
jgi:transposase